MLRAKDFDVDLDRKGTLARERWPLAYWTLWAWPALSPRDLDLSFD